jgi:hypothetical protein
MKLIVGALVVLVIMGLAMTSDYDDAVELDRVYCENVLDGTWPDYRGTYATECPGQPLRKKRHKHVGVDVGVVAEHRAP